jgi:hypothetical protein
MSKESHNKRNFKPKTKPVSTSEMPSGKSTLTPEEKARIIRDRLANRPVIVFRYPNGKLNKRFILMLALLSIAMIAALYFIARV